MLSWWAVEVCVWKNRNPVKKLYSTINCMRILELVTDYEIWESEYVTFSSVIMYLLTFIEKTVATRS